MILVMAVTALVGAAAAWRWGRALIGCTSSVPGWLLVNGLPTAATTTTTTATTKRNKQFLEPRVFALSLHYWTDKDW